MNDLQSYGTLGRHTNWRLRLTDKSQLDDPAHPDHYLGIEHRLLVQVLVRLGLNPRLARKGLLPSDAESWVITHVLVPDVW